MERVNEFVQELIDILVNMVIVLAGVVILAFFIAGPYFFIIERRQSERLLADCMQDHKEYECHAMLDSHEHDSSMPMVIPMPIFK